MVRAERKSVEVEEMEISISFVDRHPLSLSLGKKKRGSFVLGARAAAAAAAAKCKY